MQFEYLIKLYILFIYRLRHMFLWICCDQLFFYYVSTSIENVINFRNTLRLLHSFGRKNKCNMHFHGTTKMHDVNNIAYKINCKQLKDNYAPWNRFRYLIANNLFNMILARFSGAHFDQNHVIYIFSCSNFCIIQT